MENAPKKYPALQKAHDKMVQIYAGNDDLKCGKDDLQTLSAQMNKCFGRFEEDNIQSTTDVLFQIAKDKMTSEHDKNVLIGLRQMVRELEMSMYRPNARY